jgi:hypothetical protein
LAVAKISKYGKTFCQPELSQSELELEIELHTIRKLYFDGDKAQLLHHYLNAHKFLWPQDKQHRWFLLGMKTLIDNPVSVFLGPASSNKTYIFAVHSLIDFFAFKENSLSIISSTDMKSLEIKVWGRVKNLFNRARNRHFYLPGFILDSAKAITLSEADEDNAVAREMNCGLVCVACVSGGKFVGMGKFQGAKPPHSPGQYNGILKHYGDEAAVMQPSFLDAYSNWMVNNSGDRKTFKGVMGGNPTDISDPLCTAAEPVGGWDSFIDNKKTQEWTSRWYNAHVVAFDGRDSPNNDDPKNSFPFLISAGFVELMRETHGEDSWQFFQQAIGKPSRGMVSNRVITIGMCETGKAFDSPQWLNNEFIDIYALDPAFGGGDRCVGGRVRMGTFIDGTKGIEVFPPTIIPISLNSGVDPQDQIAQYVFDDATALGIPGENCFFDSFGRGTLHNHFGKFFGVNLPIAVDSGARPTSRPVRQGLYVTDKNGQKRLKRCDEEYSKFVTELWFSTREAIRMTQIRGLPKNVAYEGQLRMFKIVAGNRTEVEPKDDMKERTGKSPDLYDWFAIAIEGCRQRGFEIKGIGSDAPKGQNKKDEDNFFDSEVKAWDNAINAGLLRH